LQTAGACVPSTAAHTIAGIGHAHSTDTAPAPTLLPAAGPPQDARGSTSGAGDTRADAPRRRRCGLALSVPVLAVLAVLAGCGSSQSSGSAADPATVIPATAPIYLGADVRPAGAERSAALAAGKTLTRQSDPYLRLLGALQTPGSPQLNFEHDVAPWLGPHAGIFLSSLHSAGTLGTLLQQGLLGATAGGSNLFPFAAGGAQGAIVLDTSDESKARSFLDGQARHAGAHASPYRGVAVQSAAGVSFALVQKLVVIGSEAAVRAVIDTSQGAPPLVSSPNYSRLAQVAPSGALAHLYSNPLGTAAAGAPMAITELLGVASGRRPANISLLASAGSLALDADTLGTSATSGGVLSADPEAARAFGELPGDSWLALGLAHVGAKLAGDVSALHTLTTLLGASGSESAPATSSLNIGALLHSLLEPLEVLGAPGAAGRAYASWMGSAGIFASGSSLLELKAAVSIESTNATASRAAVAELAAQLHARGASIRTVSIAGTSAAVGIALSGLPVVLDIASGQDAAGHTKFVLGLGEASVQAALRPQSTMSQGAATQTAAAAALGEGIQPSLTADFPTVLSLIEGLGVSEDPTISKVVPYLRATTTLAGGGRALTGEVQRYRLVLGLQQPAG